MRRTAGRLRGWFAVPVFAAGFVVAAGCASDAAKEEAAPPAASPDASAASDEPPAHVVLSPRGVSVRPGGSSARTDPDAVAPELRAPRAADENEFARTLLAADRRVDEFVNLDAEARNAARHRELLASALEAFAAEHLERLLAGAAAGTDPARRLRSMKALAFANDRRATTLAVAALGESADPPLQTAAGFTLSRLADPDTSVEALLDAARSPDVDVRVNALLALARVLEARGAYSNFIDQAGREDVLALLGSALFDPEDATARGNAAAVAGALGDTRSIDPLLNLLRDQDPFVRAHTARALGQVGNRRAIDPLVEVIDESPEGAARTSVLAALAELLAKERITVPDDIDDDERAWADFVARAFAERARRPVR